MSSKVKGVADIVFLIDATAGMQSCVEVLKENLTRFLQGLTVPCPEDSFPCLGDWRAKIVGFRDYEADGPEHWFVDNPFTRNISQLQLQLNSLEVRGGGDLPESTLDAIYRVASMGETVSEEERMDRWRNRRDAMRLLFVFTDSPYKQKMVAPDLEGGELCELSNCLVLNRIPMSIVAPRGVPWDEQYNRLECIRYCSWISIPQENHTEYSWDSIFRNGALAKFVQGCLPRMCPKAPWIDGL